VPELLRRGPGVRQEEEPRAVVLDDLVHVDVDQNADLRNALKMRQSREIV
jgi:hypothetical protein